MEGPKGSSDKQTDGYGNRCTDGQMARQLSVHPSVPHVQFCIFKFNTFPVSNKKQTHVMRQTSLSATAKNGGMAASSSKLLQNSVLQRKRDACRRFSFIAQNTLV